jgi:hypothetical protein
MRGAILGSVAALALVAAPAAAAPVAKPGRARLEGDFTMTGKVTKSVRIRGQHVGQVVHRRWAFTSSCRSGPCASVQLVRQRQSGTDRLRLKRISRGYYEGNGKFYARLRCAGRLYYRGVSVPFTIQVHVTGATISGGQVLATRIRATYTNRSRRNHTPCIFIPGHDAARYSGAATTGLPLADTATAPSARSPGAPAPPTSRSPAGS